jgi:hypothetical protein
MTFAKCAIRCNSATQALEGCTAAGFSGYAWNQLNITDIPYDAELGWGFGQYSTPIEAYHHYVEGVKQEGLFLGQNNVTTWVLSRIRLMRVGGWMGCRIGG